MSKQKQARKRCANLAIRLDGGLGVLELDVFVTHERPRAKMMWIESQRAFEVHDRLGMLAFHAVIIANDETRLWSIATIAAVQIVAQ
jgi:hypothetical protein